MPLLCCASLGVVLSTPVTGNTEEKKATLYYVDLYTKMSEMTFVFDILHLGM